MPCLAAARPLRRESKAACPGTKKSRHLLRVFITNGMCPQSRRRRGRQCDAQPGVWQTLSQSKSDHLSEDPLLSSYIWALPLRMRQTPRRRRLLAVVCVEAAGCRARPQLQQLGASLAEASHSLQTAAPAPPRAPYPDATCVACDMMFLRTRAGRAADRSARELSAS